MWSKLRRLVREHTIAVITAMLLFWLVGAPIALLIYMSFASGSPANPGPLGLGNYRVVYASPQTYSALGNTIVYAAATSLFSILLAATFAWLTERTDMPGRNFAWVAMLVPIAMPGMLASISWILLLSPTIGILNILARGFLGWFGVDMQAGPINIYGMGGMIYVESLRGANTLFLLLVGAFRLMDPSLEDAATMSGSGKVATLRSVTVPLMIPALLAATIYAFLGNLEDFDTPLLLGLPAGEFILPTLIFFTAYVTTTPNWGVAAAYTTIFLLIMVVLVLYYYMVVIRQRKKYATVSGKGYRPQRIKLGRWRYPALGLFVVYFLLAVALPFLVMLWAALQPLYRVPSLELFRTLTLDNFRELFFDSPRIVRAATNSLFLGVATATVTIGIAFAISWAIVRVRVRGGLFMDALAFAPNAIPGVAIGLALVVFYLHPAINWLPIYGTLWIMVIALTTSYLAFATRLGNTSMTQVGNELEEAGWVAGVGKGRTLVGITFRLVAPAMLAGWLWVFAKAFRNLTIPLLMASPGTTGTLSMRLYEFWSRDANFPMAAALGVVMMVVLGLLAYAFRRLMARGFTGE